MFDVHVFVYTFMSISKAWASALFILDRWAMREPKRWDKQGFDSRAFSIMLVIVWNIVITIKTDKNEKTINNYDVLVRDDGSMPEC